MTRWIGRFGCVAVLLSFTGCGEAAPVVYEGDDPGECTDGADNDQDQLFDCLDPGCAGASVCQGEVAADATTDAAPEPDVVTVPDVVAAPDVSPTPDAPQADGAGDVGPEEEDLGPVEPPVDPADPCPPLSAAEGTVVAVDPSQVAALPLMVASAAEGTTFALADGIYLLDGASIWIATQGITLRSASGKRDNVILDGGFVTETAVLIAAPRVTIAELTIRQVLHQGIRVQPDPGGAPVDAARLHSIAIVDALERAVLVEAQNNQVYADGGVLACSRLALTDVGREELAESCDVGGIELRQTQGWTLRDNQVEAIWCDPETTAPGMLAWRSSADTIIERNHITDTTRAIGLGDAQTGLAGARAYEGFDCETSAHVDHYGGVVRNNMIFVGGDDFMDNGGDFESGVHLWSACDARVVHNTIVSLKAPFSSIEWRFEGTVDSRVINNIVSHNLRERTGATALELGNVIDAPETLFVDQEGGDLHLDPTAPGAIDLAEDLPVGVADYDFDGEPRFGARDIGADEHL